MKKATTFLVAFLLSLCASVSTALVTPLGGTLSLVECADGKMWSVCAPGNIPIVPKTIDPVLRFSDIISGPDTGLGDGSGSGAIVTVWGQGLGSTQGTSTIEYCDSTATCRTGHVYYWKDADGTLPSGPANLYESHGMQEIAFSIPDSAQGAGTIRVTVDGQTDTLPFTVRAGTIWHVMASGNDSTGDGSFGNPYATFAKVGSNTQVCAGCGVGGAGDIVYIHTMVVGSPTNDKPIYFNNGAATSGLANQFALIGYPNTRTEVIGHRGTANYNTEGFVVSKLDIYAASSDLGANDQPINGRTNVTMGITGSKNGRAVANAITDEHPSDANGACASGTQGAVQASNLSVDRVGNFKILGNYIYQYGCEGSSKLHHTTYISNRSAEEDTQSEAPEVAWNYLKDNPAKFGIHYYDENNTGVECGDFTTTFKIHHNVVYKQGGSGINIGAGCPETGDFEIYNNLLVDVGRAADWDGVSRTTQDGPVNGGISIGYDGWRGNISVYNNTIYKWADDLSDSAAQPCIAWQTETIDPSASFSITKNVCWTDKDKSFDNGICCDQGPPLANLTMDANVFYTSVSNPTNAVVPAHATNSITADPLLTLTGYTLSVTSGSPIENQSTLSGTDVYGVVRGGSSNSGAVQ